MRKITQQTTQAFKNRKAFWLGNTEVTIEPWTSFGEGEYLTICLLLHGNKIAEAEYSQDQGRFTILKIRDCNRKTPTTKERLNGILDAFDLPGIYQRAGLWYYTDGNAFVSGDTFYFNG